MKFIPGYSYSTRSICDHNCIIADAVSSRTARTVVTSEGQRLRMVTGTGAKREAMRQGYEWFQQAHAGLIEPTPERERLQRAAAAPINRAATAQQFDLSALPLFGDQARQLDIMDLLKT